MKAVVTGGAGFIGSWMSERLVKEKVEVIVIDNFANGRIENLKSVLKDIKIVKLDLSNYAIKDELVEICKDADFIFHFAALADSVPSIEMPLRYHKANVDGTINILEAARKSKKLKKFLYAASSSCYGIPNIYPTPETAPIKPQYPYALTKYLGEEYVLHWGKIYKIPVISLRLFNVFGPRHRTSGTYGAVFGVFLTQLLHNKPLTIVGDGEQTRDFTFVTDVAEAFWLAANSDVEVEIFNVGSGGTYSINYLVKLLGSWENRVYIPRRPGEPDCTFADIAKIKKILKWQPKIGFEEGVEVMKRYIDDFKDAPLWDKESIQKSTKKWFEYLQNCK